MLSLKFKIGRMIPKRIRPAVKFLWFFPFDLAHVITRKNPLHPPPSRIFTGDGDFIAIGKEVMETLVKEGGLNPSSMVLDIGSGVGRVSLPLVRYLKTGKYYGGEIVLDAVAWCKRKYKQYPNFKFFHIDAANSHYNPTGILNAADYIFPFQKGSFDLIFLASVFTHMYEDETRNYLEEIARLLKPNGKCVATFFIVTEHAKTSIQNKTAYYPFIHRINDHTCTATPEDPAITIAYDQAHLWEMIEKSGLIISSAKFGAWSKSENAETHQDTIVLSKAPA